MKHFKDISFWCIVLGVVVIMVVHHILSHKSDIIEGQQNDTVKCGSTEDEETGNPCCDYDLWYEKNEENETCRCPVTVGNDTETETDGIFTTDSGGIQYGRVDDHVDGTALISDPRCSNATLTTDNKPEGCDKNNRFVEETSIVNSTHFRCLTPTEINDKKLALARSLGIVVNDGDAGAEVDLSSIKADIETRKTKLDNYGINITGKTGEEINQEIENGRALRSKYCLNEDASATELNNEMERARERISLDTTKTVEGCTSTINGETVVNDTTNCNLTEENDTTDGSCTPSAEGTNLEATCVYQRGGEFSVSEDTYDGQLAVYKTNCEYFGLDPENPECINYSCKPSEYLEEAERRGSLALALSQEVCEIDPEGEETLIECEERINQLLLNKCVAEGLVQDCTSLSDCSSDCTLEKWRAAKVARRRDKVTSDIVSLNTLLDPEVISECGVDENIDDCESRRDDKIGVINSECREYSLNTTSDIPEALIQCRVSDLIDARPLYEFTTHLFTNCGSSGPTGPEYTACINAYGSSQDEGEWWRNTEFFQVIDGIQCWKCPESGIYRVTGVGAAGGDYYFGTLAEKGGQGAKVVMDYQLERGQWYWILVGQKGTNSTHIEDGAGGGGGTFFVKVPIHNGEIDVNINTNTSITNDDLLMSAGGGGGSRGHCQCVGCCGGGGRGEDGWWNGNVSPSSDGDITWGGDGKRQPSTLNTQGGNGGGPDINLPPNSTGGFWGGGGGGFIGNGGNHAEDRGETLRRLRLGSERMAEGGSSFSNGGKGGSPIDRATHVPPGGFGGGGAACFHAGGGGGGSYGGDSGVPFTNPGQGGGTYVQHAIHLTGNSDDDVLGAWQGNLEERHDRGHGYLIITRMRDSNPSDTISPLPTSCEHLQTPDKIYNVDKLTQCLTHLAVDGKHIGINSEWEDTAPPTTAPVSSYEVSTNNILEGGGPISPYCEDNIFNELCSLFGHTEIDEEYILSLPDTNVQSTVASDAAQTPGKGYWPPQGCQIFDDEGNFINTVSTGNSPSNKQIDSVKCSGIAMPRNLPPLLSRRRLLGLEDAPNAAAATEAAAEAAATTECGVGERQYRLGSSGRVICVADCAFNLTSDLGSWEGCKRHPNPASCCSSYRAAKSRCIAEAATGAETLDDCMEDEGFY